MPVNSPNTGVAFAMVSCAGMATAVGAAVVFFPRLVKLASRKVLASALGLSAGVMTYVSFVEIFQKSLGSFQDSGLEEKIAYSYATLCFFGGVLFMIVLHNIVHVLAGEHEHVHMDSFPADCSKNSVCKEVVSDENKLDEDKSTIKPQYCVGCSTDPVQDLDNWQHMAEEEEERRKHSEEQTGEGTSFSLESGDAGQSNEADKKSTTSADLQEADQHQVEVDLTELGENEKKIMEERKQLARMGLHTALAIGLHNFPEGLATFVATLDDAKVGGVLAVAIGIHNIPEGLCVALPIYYATGDRKRAFLWALLSGLSEPIAAFLGWLVLANNFSDTSYAIMFGLVAGMMVYISTKELLPTAYRYDSEDTVVTNSWIFGMAIMALSLVLFQL